MSEQAEHTDWKPSFQELQVFENVMIFGDLYKTFQHVISFEVQLSTLRYLQNEGYISIR